MPRGDVEERADTVPLLEEEGLEAQLEQVLLQLRRKARGVRGSVIADSNGLTVAGDIRGGVSASVLAAMSTLVAGSAEGVFENLHMPAPDFILMEGPAANVAVTHMASGEASLLALADKATNLGVLKIEMRRAAVQIAAALGLAGGRASITELFVLHKSGLLIRHYSDSLRTDIDRDILGGMLVAVQNFVKQTLATKAGSLDQLRYGEYTIFFVRGVDVIAAAVARDGDAETVQYHVMDAVQDFEERYGSTLRSWNGDMAAFAGVDETFEKVLRA